MNKRDIANEEEAIVDPAPTKSSDGMDYIILPRNRYSETLEDVYIEILKARVKHGKRDYSSQHEGYAILKEEVDEAWDDIKANRDLPAKKEMLQVAAVATRFVAEL